MSGTALVYSQPQYQFGKKKKQLDFVFPFSETLLLDHRHFSELVLSRFDRRVQYLKGRVMRLSGLAGHESYAQWVTMKLEHTKSAESLIRGCSVAQQVHLLSQLRILELMGTRSLPTPGLCQPRSLPEP